MKTILITGASGFFGKSFLVATLKNTEAKDARIVCVSSSLPRDSSSERCDWIRCDLLNASARLKLIQEIRPTHLAHFAWSVPPREFWTSEMNREWVRASLDLFQKFAEAGGKTFLGAGSGAEYDWSSGTLTEATPLIPATLYGQSKVELYTKMRDLRLQNAWKVNIHWARIGYFFGETEAPQKLISTLIRGIRDGVELKLSVAETERPYAHVKRFGETVAPLFLNQEKDLTFNISGPRPISLREIVDFISQKIGRKPRIEYGGYQAPVGEPLILQIQSETLRDLGSEVPDRFFEDLCTLIEGPKV